MTNKYQIKIIKKLAEMSGTSPEDWFLTSRARHGIEVVLKVLAEDYPAGEVITQPFTCVTAVNPIFSAKLTPVYADIRKDNLSIDPSSTMTILNNKSVAVMVQHTLGLRASVEEIANLIKDKNCILIEDSAHCLGRVSLDHADVSVHSFGAEKILPTSFGSAVWINPNIRNKDLGKRLRLALNSLPKMTIVENLKYLIYPLLNKIINVLPQNLSVNLKSFLKNTNLLVTPIMPIELKRQNYQSPKKLSVLLSKKIYKYLMEIEKSNEMRRGSTYIYEKIYNKVLKVNYKDIYVRFPFIASTPEQADSIFNVLRSKNISAGKWYRPLFFPGVDEKLYFYNKVSCPVAEECSKLIVNLPTNVNTVTAKKVVNEINSIRA